jgi:hypothetical protein
MQTKRRAGPIPAAPSSLSLIRGEKRFFIFDVTFRQSAGLRGMNLRQIALWTPRLSRLAIQPKHHRGGNLMTIRSIRTAGAGLLVLGLSVLGAQAQSGTPIGHVEGMELLPKNAKPGECYARVFVPPASRTETEQVLAREKSSRVEIVPAKYEWVEQEVLVQEASHKIEVIPARYEWVEERVEVKEASSRMEEVPAVYEWLEEQILVEDAHTVWKKGRGPIEKVDNGTGEIMCLVEVPATYKTVKKRVLKSPATTRKVEIPAEYKTIKKKVQAEPATTRKVEIPAQYDTVKVRKMVEPPREQRIEIPAEYQTITRTVRASDGKMEWRPVLCQTNMTRTTIRDLQIALRDAGHNPGPIDGIYGSQTSAAVRSYQQAKSLPTGGLTLDTLKKLGVNL